MLKAILCLIMVSGCHFVATGKLEQPKKPVIKTARQRAVDIAIVKYLIDDTWGVRELNKEIKYQLYLAKKATK